MSPRWAIAKSGAKLRRIFELCNKKSKNLAFFAILKLFHLVFARYVGKMLYFRSLKS